MLQLKTGGQNPSQLADACAPVVNIKEFWDNYLEINLFPFSAVNVAAAGSFQLTGAGPPAGFMWYVRECEVSCSLLAAETIRGAVTMFDPNNGGRVQLGPDVADTITARARQWACTSWGPFWMLPGMNLGVHVFDAATAANIAVGAVCRGVVLPI